MTERLMCSRGVPRGMTRARGLLEGEAEVRVGEAIDVDDVAFAEDDGAFDDVAQFADVAGPGVALEGDEGGLGEVGDVAVMGGGEVGEEVLGE